MILRPLETETEYANASGVSLYSWSRYPETLIIDAMPESAPRAAYLAHCILHLGARANDEFLGCEIAIAAHFQGEPLEEIEQELLRTTLTGLLGKVPESLVCLLAFSKAEFVQARTLFALLCAHEWESQLIVPGHDLVCNVSHDEYIALYSRNQEFLEIVRSNLVADGFLVKKRKDV